MSLKVGELVAYIRADGTEFDRQVDQSGQKFQGLGRTISAGTQAIARSFAAVTTAGVALGVAVFKIGADYNRLQQSSRAALTTLLGSAEAANAQMDKLDTFAKTSPFAKQVFITAQQQLIGFGVSAEKVLPTLDAIQNAVAAVGGSNEQVSQVTYALAQMQGQGKLTGETLNQLGQYGIDAATILGERLGKTGAEIRELASKPGGIPVDEIWDPLVDGLMERFGGATANIKLQMDGAVDRVKGAWRDIGSILAAPFIDPQGGGRAVEWTNKVADTLRSLEQKAGPLVDLLVDRFTPALDKVSPTLDKVRGAINRWDLSKVNDQLDELTGYAPLIASTSAALFALGTRNLPVLSTLGITGINPVVAGIAALVATSPSLRTLGTDLLTALSPLAPVAGQLALTLADTALQVGDALVPALSELLLALAPVVVVLAENLAPGLVAVVQAATPVAEVLADVIGWVADLPMPVLAAVTAFTALTVLRVPLTTMLSTAGTLFGTIYTKASAAALGTRTMALASGEARLAVSGLSTALKGAFISNPVGLAIAAISTAIGAFISRQQEAKQRVDDYKGSLDQATAAITENTRAIAFNTLEQDGMIDKAKRLGISLEDLVDAALDPTSEAAGRLEAGFKALEESFPESGNRSEETKAWNDYVEVLRAVGVEQEAVAESQARQRDEIAAGIGVTEEATEATSTHVNTLQELRDIQREAAASTLSLREAQIAEADTLDRVNATIADGAAVTRDAKGAVDENAESTRIADKTLLDYVRSMTTTTEAMRRNNASSRELDEAIRTQRESFVRAAEQMGYNRQEAWQLAEAYGLIPNEVITELIAEAEEAQRTINSFIETNDGRVIRIKVTATGDVAYNYGGPNWAMAQGGIMEFYARGGLRSGLRPMDAIAQMVPPNTWRVVGDRGDVPEAYIPLDRSTRSLAILDEAAARLGRFTVPADVQHFATGGITTRGAATATRAPVQINLTVTGDLTGEAQRTVDRAMVRLRETLALEGLDRMVVT